jgi:MFS family permease
MTLANATRRTPATLREAWIALVGLSAVFLFEMLDNSVLNVALPTIGRDLHASTTGLQWVTGVYSVVFGGLMLLFGAVADRVGRRRVMLVGLVLLAAASLSTFLVSNAGELIAVRAAMGVAAAMTTPGSIALAFRLFDDDGIRVRAISLISMVGIVGLAVGPLVGGLVLAVAPWQVLLVANAPVAALAFVGILVGVPKDNPAGLHPDPVDALGGVLGTIAIVGALLVPTLFVDAGAAAWQPWAVAGLAAAAALLFVWRARTARHPLVDLRLVAQPLVAAGLAYKVATALSLAGMGYLVTLQLQLGYGWPPALAALGMLPQVAVLIALSPFVERIVGRLGFDRTAWLSAAAVVLGLALYGLLNGAGYVWVAVSLMLVAAGIRVNGVVAGNNVLRGLPENRTSIGAALVDTAQEVATGAGIAATGTILAAVFTGSIAAGGWDRQQSDQFHLAVTVAALALAVVAGALAVWAFTRGRRGRETAPAGE